MPAAADGTLRFTVPVAQDGVGVAFRVQDIDNMWMLYVQPSTNSLVLAKRVGGSETQVATIANACCAASDTYAVTMSGGLLSVLRNNRVVGSASDIAFSIAAYLAAAGTRNTATVVGAADGAFSFAMPVAQAGVGLVFRSADANNFWRLVAQPARTPGS